MSEVIGQLQASEHIGLIPSEKKRGRKYRILPRGVEEVLKGEERRFSDENPLTISCETGVALMVPTAFSFIVESDIKPPVPHLPKSHPVFPLPTTATIRVSKNGMAAIDSWLESMAGNEMRKGSRDLGELRRSVILHHFANPMTKKLREVLFERTRMLCKQYSRGDKASPPSVDNILNFNFQFAYRYEGERLLEPGSEREKRARAKHVLAGIALLHLSSPERGLIGSLVWDRKSLHALIDADLVTKEELQPLLNACKRREVRGPEILRTDSLSDEDKRQLMISAHRRLYVASLFDRPTKKRDFSRVSWKEWLELLPVARIAPQLCETKLIRQAEYYRKKQLLDRRKLLVECSRRLSLPSERLESLVDRLAELGLISFP